MVPLPRAPQSSVLHCVVRKVEVAVRHILMVFPEGVVLTEDGIPQGNIEASEFCLIVAPEPVASVFLALNTGQPHQ